MDGRIRPATPEDVDEIVHLVRDLAEYEKAVGEARATPEQFRRALFADSPAVFAHVVEHESGQGRLGGFALWFVTFSTWLGSHGIYLEDLYVRPELRGSGYGTALLRSLAAECVDRGYGRLEWTVLDWNTDAWGFYRSHGAVAMEDWTVHRMTGDALVSMARGREWTTR